MKQLKLLKNDAKFYGGKFRNKRKGRGARPIATKHSMHIVLRSTKARGKMSFLKQRKAIRREIDRFAKKFGVKIVSVANVGNHLHLLIQLTNRYTYRAFIRSVTGRIAMLITGKQKGNAHGDNEKRFWDHRPYSRVVIGYRALLTVKDYILVNQLEGQGQSRDYSSIVVQEFHKSG